MATPAAHVRAVYVLATAKSGADEFINMMHGSDLIRVELFNISERSRPFLSYKVIKKF